jgi:hypothetical protein
MIDTLFRNGPGACCLSQLPCRSRIRQGLIDRRRQAIYISWWAPHPATPPLDRFGGQGVA